MADIPDRPRSRALITAIAALLVAIGGVLGALANPDANEAPVPRPAATAARPSSPTATSTAVISAAPAGDLAGTPPEGDHATDSPADSALRDETPPGVPAQALEQGKHAAEEAAKSLPPAPLPIAGAQNYSCPDDFKGHVWSDRAPGARVMSFKLHYTVSPNVPGKADVLGIRDYFARTRLGSANLILDFEGNCIHEVPWDAKAWTQGAFNSTSESVEIIATGKETREQWLAAPIIRDGILAAIVRDRLHARGLPLRRVDPVGCVDQEGVTDHNALECGNNHTDVAPNFPWDIFMRQLTDAPTPTFDLRPLTVGERHNATMLIAQRKTARRHGGWSNVAPSHLAAANKAKDGLRNSLVFLKAHRTDKKANRAVRYALIHAIVG